MAIHVEPRLIGVDVAKTERVIRQSWSSNLVKLGNERKAIDSCLKALSGPVCLAVEATNIFHVLLVERAHALGHTVYVIDGLRLKRYRESIGGRAKTDASDAALLLRYLTHERADLRPWSPPPAGYATVQRLLRRRAVLVQAQTTLRQSRQCLPELKTSTRAMLAQMAHLQHLIDKRVQQALVRQGWKDDARRCEGIEGIGPVNRRGLDPDLSSRRLQERRRLYRLHRHGRACTRVRHLQRAAQADQEGRPGTASAALHGRHDRLSIQYLEAFLRARQDTRPDPYSGACRARPPARAHCFCVAQKPV